MITNNIKEAYKHSLEPLNAAEERALISLAHEGKSSASDVILRSNLPLILKIVKSSAFWKLANGSNGSMTPDDLLQEAYVAVLQGIHTFKLKKGIRFSSYMGRCILSHLKRAYRQQAHLIKIPVGKQDKISQMNAYIHKNPEASFEEIAKDIDVKVEDVIFLRSLTSRKEFSVDDPDLFTNVENNNFDDEENVGDYYE